MFKTENVGGLNDVFPPISYSTWIFIIALCGMVISISLFLFLTGSVLIVETKKFFNKKSKQKVSRRKLRKIFTDILSQIETDHLAGILTDDDAYYEISRAIREYASLKTKVDLRTSTLDEIPKTDQFEFLIQTIEKLYKTEFADRSTANIQVETPAQAIALTKGLLKNW